MPETHWSVVHRLRAEDPELRQEALSEVCKSYWQPLYSLARALRNTPHDAEDLTQSFLAKLCERGDLGELEPERGRFRSLLKTAFRNHIKDASRAHRATRRGGGVETLPLDLEAGERRFSRGFEAEHDPGRLYDRQWALAILERAGKACRSDYTVRNKTKEYDLLEEALAPDGKLPRYAELAEKLGCPEASVATKVNRMRTAFGLHLRAAAADTVSSPDEVEEELNYLLRLL